MRNTRNLLLKVVMVVCAVAVCMTAYYGVRMFELQNGIKILDKIQVLLWSIVFFASVATIRKERRTKKVVNNA